MSPATLPLFAPSPTPSTIPPNSFLPLPPAQPAYPSPPPANNNPNGYLTSEDLVNYLTTVDLFIGLWLYTFAICAALFFGFSLRTLVPIYLAKIQRRRLLKLGGTPGEVGVSMSPSKNMAKVKEWGKEIKVRKQERKEQRKRERGKVAGALGQDFSGAGRQGRKLESVLEDVEMQWIEIGLGDGGKCWDGDVKKG